MKLAINMTGLALGRGRECEEFNEGLLFDALTVYQPSRAFERAPALTIAMTILPFGD